MKKCRRCDIVFHNDSRLRCLYCDTLLSHTDSEDTGRSGWLSPNAPIMQQVIEHRRIFGESHIEYILGAYFRIRTYHFGYKYSRNVFKMGQKFKQLLIQPISIIHMLILPWMVVDIIDSVYIQFFYHGYCDKCGWKYRPRSKIIGHESKECHYNQEYTAIIKDILSGQILKTEESYLLLGEKKVKEGDRSAYFDLCTKKKYLSPVIDMVFVWFSMCILLLFVVMLLFPAALYFFHNLE